MIRYRDRKTGGINGVITIRTLSKETGEVLDEFVDNNIVTLNGMEKLWTRMSSSADASANKLSNFVLGSDYGVEEGGDWSMFAPKPANREYDKDNQIDFYVDSPDNIAFTYPSDTEMQVGTILDGTYIINNFFSDETIVFYNSATIRFGDGTVFAYKRFPVRSITKVVDVQISWRFTLVDSALFDCTIVDPFTNPEPNHNLGISVYAGYYGNNRIHKISDDGEQRWIYRGHSDWVTDIQTNNDYLFSVSRDKSVHIIDKTTGDAYKTFDDVHADSISRILVDGEHFVTISEDRMVIKHNFETEELMWSVSPEDLLPNPTPNSVPTAIIKSLFDGYYLIAYRDGHIVEILSRNGSYVNSYYLGVELIELETTPDNDIILSVYDEPPENNPAGAYGYAIIRYSPEAEVTQFVIDEYSDYSFRVIYDKTGNTNTPDFYVASDEGNVTRYNRAGNKVWEFTDHSDVVRGLAFDKFGYIYSGSDDQTLKKISPNGNQVWAYTQNENPVSAVAVDPEPRSDDDDGD